MYGDVQQSHHLDNRGLWRAAYWKLTFCWLPKRCCLTGKKLWGCHAYRGENWITGPGEPLMLSYWIEKTEFLVWNLKGRQ